MESTQPTALPSGGILGNFGIFQVLVAPVPYLLHERMDASSDAARWGQAPAFGVQQLAMENLQYLAAAVSASAWGGGQGAPRLPAGLIGMGGLQHSALQQAALQHAALQKAALQQAALQGSGGSAGGAVYGLSPSVLASSCFAAPALGGFFGADALAAAVATSGASSAAGMAQTSTESAAGVAVASSGPVLVQEALACQEALQSMLAAQGLSQLNPPLAMGAVAASVTTRSSAGGM